jgi:pimeloyl-[acyl-carrier protein] synthase
MQWNLQSSSPTQWSEDLTLYNLTDPAIIANPYFWYEQLRPLGPIFLDTTVGWVCTGFAECDHILKEERCFAINKVPIPDRTIAAIIDQQMLFLDAHQGDHQHIRRLLTPRLLSNAKDGWQPYIDTLVRHLLTPLQQEGREEMDLVEEFAGVLPMLLNVALLGLPVEDLQAFLRWNDAYEQLLGLPCSDPTELLEIMKQQIDYFSHIIDSKRRHPGDDLISDLIHGDLTNEQIIANSIVLLAGGYETTTHLITMALYWLFHHPDQLRQLRQNPTLIKVTLKEVLRYDGSSQFLTRRTTMDTIVGGQVIPAQHLIFVLLAAANRDGRQFTDADGRANAHIFDIRRSHTRHLTFGAGRHTCLGSSVAEQVASLAVLGFLALFPEYAVPTPYEQLPWKLVHSNVRSLEHMPVRLQTMR